MKYLTRIYGILPYANIEIDIPISGKNLIITGKNGIGKTTFLNNLHLSLQTIFDKTIDQIPEIQRMISWCENELSTNSVGTHQFTQALERLNYYHSQLQSIRTPISAEIENSLNLCKQFDEFKAVFIRFDAMRTSSIQAATGSTSIEAEKEQYKNTIARNNDFSQKLEQHLLNIRTQKSFAITESNNQAQAQQFEEWFRNFDKQLQFLFEDNSIHLEFVQKEMKHYLCTEKKKFNFQNLSSGYQAILQIYADLLMRTEFYEITPTELEGIVLIDEIDAHLHISLQRIILPFFTNAFPNIQFIVTTHSPFVITSTDEDTAVYDLSTNQYIQDDLSLYSNEAIIKGLFHVNTDSKELEALISELTTLIQTDDNYNFSKIREIIKTLQLQEANLSINGRITYYLALNLLSDHNEMGELDV